MQSTLPGDRAISANTHRKSAQSELAVLQLIHRKNNVSRVELVELTGLSTGLISGITQALIRKRLVIETPGLSDVAGRKPIALSVRHDAAYVVGVDLGSFYLRVVVTDLHGRLLHKLQTETSLSEGRKRVL